MMCRSTGTDNHQQDQQKIRPSLPSWLSVTVVFFDETSTTLKQRGSNQLQTAFADNNIHKTRSVYYGLNSLQLESNSQTEKEHR